MTDIETKESTMFSKYKTSHHYVQCRKTKLWYNPSEQFNELVKTLTKGK